MAITIRFTGETSKISWAALPVEPVCMGKAVGEARRPLMLCGARLYIITYRNMKIKATKYRNDYRVWSDYTGDYRNENIE